MDLGIRDLRVLVTAGASGIGLATARAFLREGARVHVCDVDEGTRGLAEARAGMSAQRVRRVGPGGGRAPVRDVQRQLGGLDALVNNAGIAGPTAPCEDVALADWERTLAVNLTGQFLCAQRAIPLLKAERATRASPTCRRPRAASAFPIARPTRRPSGASSASPSRCRWSSAPSASASTRSAPAPSRASASSACSRARPRCATSHPTSCATRCSRKTSLRRLVTADDIANAIVFLASARRQHLRPRAAGGCGYAGARLRLEPQARPSLRPRVRRRHEIETGVLAQTARAPQELARRRRRSARRRPQAGRRCRSRTWAAPSTRPANAACMRSKLPR